MKKMSFDIDGLKANADILSILDKLGVNYYKRGSNYFMYCPSPDHDDNRATNCYFKENWNSVCCKACSKNFDAIDLVMYTAGISFSDALKMLWECEGSPKELVKSSINTYEDGVKARPILLSRTELKALGIKLPRMVDVPVFCSDEKEYMSNEMPKGLKVDSKEIDKYLYLKSVPITWQDFLSVSDYNRMIISKTREKLSVIDNLDLTDQKIIKGLITKIA